jgi:hypothetical protein
VSLAPKNLSLMSGMEADSRFKANQTAYGISFFIARIGLATGGLHGALCDPSPSFDRSGGQSGNAAA